MRLYFFDIDGEEPDDIGAHCENLAKAKCEAVELAGRIMCDESEAFWEKKEWGMTVTNSERLALFSLNFFATEAPAITVA